jgi:predicted DNA-binding transcriptional regulator YafY
MARQGSISETLFRHWQMLRLIPRAPRKIDGATLERLLRQEGIEVQRRSIQRDLESLATTFTALECDERSKPYGWSWSRDAPVLELPPMNVPTAVTLDLVRAYLLQALPRTTLKSLDPYFDRAQEILAQSSGAKLAKWPKKVRVVARGVSLVPPNVSAKVLDVVYTSLLEERRFTASYRPRGAKADKTYEVNPLGLVLRHGALVLVCTFRDYDDVNQVLLHRVSDAELLATASRTPRGFDLDAHIESGGVAFKQGPPLKLEALVSKQAAMTLQETALSKDQELTPYDGEHELLKATVPSTFELRAWLRSYGPAVEVLAPKSLRTEMADAARATARMYAKG